MRPFDLQKALAGDKVARKLDMKEPEEWHYFEKKSGEWSILCIFSGDCLWFTREGKFDRSQDSDRDLVILPKKKKLFINVNKRNRNSSDIHETTNAYPTRELAQAATFEESFTVEIEIDDE